MHSLEINDIIYWYWWLAPVLGTIIYGVKTLVESDRRRLDHD